MKMMNITIYLILGNFLVILIGSVFIGKIQNDMIKTLYYQYNEVWRELGAPGGWFWRPPGRGWLENEISTMRFWNENSYSFAKPNIIPKEILGFHRKYYSYIGVILAILILLNVSINLIFLKTGSGS